MEFVYKWEKKVHQQQESAVSDFQTTSEGARTTSLLDVQTQHKAVHTGTLTSSPLLMAGGTGAMRSVRVSQELPISIPKKHLYL